VVVPVYLGMDWPPWQWQATVGTGSAHGASSLTEPEVAEEVDEGKKEKE
jgi:hypothetical protein